MKWSLPGHRRGRRKKEYEWINKSFSCNIQKKKMQVFRTHCIIKSKSILTGFRYISLVRTNTSSMELSSWIHIDFWIQNYLWFFFSCYYLSHFQFTYLFIHFLFRFFVCAFVAFCNQKDLIWCQFEESS